MKTLNIDPNKHIVWKECNDRITSRFRLQKSPPAIQLLPGILKEIQVTLLIGTGSFMLKVLSGDKDIICNHRGIEDLIEAMEWNGRKGFSQEDGTVAEKYRWLFMDKLAGYYQYARNLTYVLVKDASHMVPYDKPLESQDMFNRFLGINSEVIEAVRKLNTMEGFGVREVGYIISDSASKMLDKQRSAWSLYYRITGIILMFLVIATIFFAWYLYNNHKKLREDYINKYGNTMNYDHCEHGDGSTHNRINPPIYHPENKFCHYNGYMDMSCSKKDGMQAHEVGESSLSDYRRLSHEDR
ncbi:hypothetical protein PCK2_000629 [Pneumocystis canis]|nr:hypothetical protein PCK2_000629 [Pneumocystis canis]